MRLSLLRWGKLALVGLIVTTISTTGCKSGWKMPGKDLFSWNKKPSEETLAGQGPSMTYPTSPAANHSPMAVNSMGAGGSSSLNTGLVAKSSGPSVSPTGYGTTPPMAQGGGAAGANGYQTGPYGTSGAAGAYAARSTSTPYGTALGSTPSASTGMTGGYSAGPTSSTGAPPYTPVGSQPMASNNPYASRPMATPSVAPSGTPAIPTGYSQQGMTTGQPSSAGSNPYASAGSTNSYAYGANPYASSAPAMAPTTVNPYASSATSMATPTAAAYGDSTGVATASGAYRPGSTARTTSYDISAPSATYAGGSGAPSYSPPQSSTPMMASPSGSAGYAVPPSIVR